MFYPVTIKDAKGKVKRVVSSEELEERDTQLANASRDYHGNAKVREKVCPKCGKHYWTIAKNSKYCNNPCNNSRKKKE